MSVSDKVNRFTKTAENVSRAKPSAPFQPIEISIDDISEPEDECLLSVNEKVTKFLNTTDETSVMNKSIRHEVVTDEEYMPSVSDKVNKFIATTEKLSSSAPQKSPEMVKNIMRKSTTRTYEESEDESVLQQEDRSDSRSTLMSGTGSEMTLKSTEAVKKARAIFENKAEPSLWDTKRTSRTTTTTTERRTNKQNDHDVQFREKTPVFRRPSKERTPEYEEPEYKPSSRKPSKNQRQEDDDYSPERRPSSQRPSNERTPESRFAEPEYKPSGRGPSSDRTSQSKPATSRPSKNQPEDHQPSTRRPSKHQPEEVYEEEPQKIERKPSKDHRSPGYLKDAVSTKKDLFEKKISSSKIDTTIIDRKSYSPQMSYEGDESEPKYPAGPNPSYMNHTVASIEHINNSNNTTVRRESVDRVSQVSQEVKTKSSTPTKFGVELKRTESGRNSMTTRQASVTELPNIDDIYDLNLLEKMLSTSTSYEHRRLIRAQIRVVKKMHADAVSTTVTTTRTVKTNNIVQKPVSTVTVKTRETSFTSAPITKSPASVSAPLKREEPAAPSTRTPKFNIREEKSPKSIIDNFNKNSTNTTEKRSFAKTTTSAVKKTNNQSSRQVTDHDSVTSSYGVGPMDSNGLPIFGLRALKKKPTTTTETKGILKNFAIK